MIDAVADKIENPNFSVTLTRTLQKRTSLDKIQKQIEFIAKSAKDYRWKYEISISEPVQSNDKWIFKSIVVFTKIGNFTSSVIENQKACIEREVSERGASTSFMSNKWYVNNAENEKQHIQIMEVKEKKQEEENKSKTIHPINVKKWEDLVVPEELLGENSNEKLREHDAWKNIYGVNPQIRVILSNIKRAQETNGESRNHAVLFGHAGCGKTSTMFALEKMFGQGSVLKLDATSTTKAGLEKLFFGELDEVPPLVFMEEAEKADPEALKIWLGALDDRGEIRKINYRTNQLRKIQVLFICSVNNKHLFDKMMGSDGTQAGAFSSRCVTQLYFPRPSTDVLRQILLKEIKDHGGKEEWIGPVIEMAETLKITDPRVVKSYLAGGDRLLDGTYQRDWIAIQQAQESFNK